MRRRLTAGLAVLALLALAGTATARYYLPKPHHACKAGYVKRTVKMMEHHTVHEHGHVYHWLVRHHGRVVWIKQARCVYVGPTATAGIPSVSGGSSAPVSGGSSAPISTPPAYAIK